MRMTTPRAEDIGTSLGGAVPDPPQELSSSSSSRALAASSGAMPPSSSPVQGTIDDVIKMGYLKKFKGRKKWFVVRGESESGPARLEYYAKERYFRLGQPPRRNISLKACFNINRTESKVKWAIALHTHNDCLRIVFSSEEEMKEWLQLLNSLAGSEEEPSEDVPSKPHFEHVWLVQALNKGLGSKEGILGPYRLCLTSRELTLLRVGDGDDKNSDLKFPLNVIRSVSHDSTFGCFFHIEFGRSAVTGPGQLSLRTEDNNIAGNMHLLILKAMQNYSKEELAYRDVPRRGRTYTWNSTYSESASRPPSFASQTPPVMTRLHSVDSGTPRLRTESMTSTDSRSGSSPPISISLSHQTPPTISFHSPLLYSTTDSASSSYSVDYENNNNGDTRGAREEEQDSYVPWNPSEEPTLSLPLQPLDTADYVTTGGQRLGSRTTSYMHMDLQSPTAFDNYVPMSPGSSLLPGGGSGKLSVSHSRNSSLVEDIEGYVPMVPGQQASTPMSNGGGGMGSTSNIDSSYLEMDLSSSSRRKLNLSNEDRSLPASSVESLQSRTPSSDFPLEKVSSYFLPSDDLDDTGRAVRAYSVGSRSDTGAVKGRYGKNRLEAVQESFRIRALSVGAKNPRTNKGINLFSPPPLTPPNSSAHGSMSSVSTGTGPQLSSSWSGSPGRWAQMRSQISPASSQSQHTNSEHGDSDLMELDFSHNRPGRRKSLSGIREQSTSCGTSSTSSKSSPAGEPYMSMQIGESSKYTSSAPITIQKTIGESLHGGGGMGPLTGRMTGLDLNPLPSKDEYMSMDFAPVVAKTLENVTPAPFPLPLTTQESSLPTSQPLSRIEESQQESWPLQAVTYADVETGPGTQAHSLTSNPSRPSYPAVNYSQIDFKKSPTT